MNRLSLALLGAPTVQQGEQIATFRTRKALALLIYLAVEGGVHARDNLVTLFWPESDQSRGRAALRSTLAYLRRALEELEESAPRPPDPPEGGEKRKVPRLGGPHPYLLIERNTLSFNTEADFEGDWLTLRVAWTAARSSLPATDEPAAHDTLLAQFQAAVDLYRGDFLTGFSLEDAPEFDDWASTQRETCHRQMSLIFDRLSQLQTEGGELHNALETTARWIALDPLNEIAHRRLMQLHFAAEDRSAALLAYDHCRDLLARELNAAPAPETEALADRIRAGEQQSKEAELLAPAHHHPSVVSLPLVGRANEHLALVTAYRAMRRGQPHLVSLEGEPGIGKTRLAQEFLGWAIAQGADVLEGRAFETGSRVPYQALVEALRDRLDRENAPDDLLSDLWLAELSQLLPELRERYPDLPTPSTEASTAQTRLFEAVTRLGQALAQCAPLILFIDDVQWVEAASLDLLQYAVRRWAAAGEPLLLLLTIRTEAVANPGSTLARWLMTLQRDIPVTRLSLAPLVYEDVERLIQTLVVSTDDERRRTNNKPRTKNDTLASMASPSFLEALSQRLFSDTGGQPFFLAETLKMLFESSEPSLLGLEQAALETPLPAPIDINEVVGRYLQTDNGAAMPPSVQEMIGARLTRLSSAAQTACLAAAVLDDNFDFERLYRVAGFDENQGLEALEELLGRGLLREQRQVTIRPYGLAHDHFRKVIYNQSGLARRRIFHRRAFEVLSTDQAPPAELARHALAAGLLEPAFALSLEAGEAALRLYAPQTAITYFNQALEATQQVGLTPPVYLYRVRGQAYETVGDFERAQRDFQQALTQTRTEGDPHGEWHALQDLGLLWASQDYAQAGDYFRQALNLARRSNEPDTLARSLNRVGNWQANIEQPFAALDHHQEALAIFETLADRAGQAETLDFLGMASFMAGDLFKSCVYYERAVTLFRELDNRTGLVSSLPMLALVKRNIFSLGVPADTDLSQCVPLAESAVELARDIEWRAGECNAFLALGLTYAFQGDYGQGLAAINQAVTIAEEIKHRLWLAYGHWALGIIYMSLLALPEAQHYLERAVALARETGSMFWTHAASALLAGIYGWQQAFDRAEAVIEAALGQTERQPDAVDWSSLTTMQRLLWFAQAQLALARSEPQLALDITENLIDSTLNLTPERPAYRLFTLRGQALLALGRLDEAEAALNDALAAAAKQDEPMMIWRIHQALGQVYSAQSRQDEASAAFIAAETLIEQLAATIPDTALRDNFWQSALRLLDRQPGDKT